MSFGRYIEHFMKLNVCIYIQNATHPKHLHKYTCNMFTFFSPFHLLKLNRNVNTLHVPCPSLERIRQTHDNGISVFHPLLSRQLVRFLRIT